MAMCTEVRRLVFTKSKSERVICREYEIHRKILVHTEPAGLLAENTTCKAETRFVCAADARDADVGSDHFLSVFLGSKIANATGFLKSGGESRRIESLGN